MLGIRCVRDFDHGDELVQIRGAFESFRGGVALELVHHHGMTPESVSNLLQDYRWHRPIEAWWDSAADIDATHVTYLPRQRYLIMPTSPSPLGFQFAQNRGVYQGNHYWRFAAAIPFWALLTLFAVYPSVRAWRRRRTHALSDQCRCAFCGYDLRASKERCPECGTAIPAKANP
jgi:hypothetical protein